MSHPADGLVLVAKRDCPTCQLVTPVCDQLLAGGAALTVFSQDDPAFPENVPGVRDDLSLETSWRLGIETVPTLLRMAGGEEVARAEGWHRDEWERVSGIDALGAGLVDQQPGCGSMSVAQVRPRPVGAAPAPPSRQGQRKAGWRGLLLSRYLEVSLSSSGRARAAA